MGNPKKPDHLKLLQGTHRKDRANPKEPKPKRGIPSCPKHLGSIAKKEWKRVSKILDKSRLLTHADLAGLMIYCELYERLVETSRAFDEGGRKMTITVPILDGDNKVAGYSDPKPNPLVIIHRQTIQAIRPYLSAYGLTPFDRPRLQVLDDGKQSQDEDPLGLMEG
jgi:P27 family predicted phage terminase small subunit